MKLQVYDGRDNKDMELLEFDVSPFFKLKYRHKTNEATCGITNIMNTLDIIGDKNMNKLLPCLDITVWQKICAQEAEEISTGKNIDNLNVMF